MAQVAEYWREHFDLSYIVERDWATLRSKLDGKMHVYCGTMDNFCARIPRPSLWPMLVAVELTGFVPAAARRALRARSKPPLIRSFRSVQTNHMTRWLAACWSRY